MVIEELRSMTRDQLLRNTDLATKVAVYRDNDQIILKDTVMTVRGLRNVLGIKPMTWGA